MTLLTQPGPHHRHVDHDTGIILHVDPITGQILKSHTMVLPKSKEDQFKAWATERQACESLAEDHLKTSPVVAPDAQAVISEEPVRGRGRPKAAFKNPVAAYMHLLAVPYLLPWVDDIIKGSIITSAGISNGKINVKTGAVIGALFAEDITAEVCKTQEISLRTAQRVAKAARHAAHGIASYVDRHPELKAEVEAEVSAEALFRGYQA